MMTRYDMAAVYGLRAARSIIIQEARPSGGRVFGSAGDSFMLEFADALAATECAMRIQKAVLAR
jgi:class 3 adenylate cyclase